MLLLLRIWIFFCAAITAAGWIASTIGQLNRAAYLLAAGIFVGVLLRTVRGHRTCFSVAMWRRRFSRPAPLFYLVLTVFAIAGGLIYQPTNIDGYSYRIPRVLHWLEAGRWHWIHTADMRMNIVATGFDWLSAPLILFTRADRAIVLINAISFLLLPGALYLTLHRLGLRRRTAWWWMWIVPGGFCYFMQAGSIVNDMYATVFTLSAVGFALRARATKKLEDLWPSMLALALATGAKQTNLPFALPWLIAAWPVLRLVFHRLTASLLVAVLAILSSVLPTSILNVAHGFPWQGFLPGRDYAPPNAFWGVVGNSFWLLFSNLQPPIIVWAGKWNAWRAEFLASELGEPFRSFQVFAYLYRAASEQYSGVGCTVLVLALLSWVAARRFGKPESRWDTAKLIRLSVWFGLLVFMAKVGINQAPRYLAPWYPFLLASLLLGRGQSRLVRQKWWRMAGCAVLIAAIGLTVLSRQRPLFPAETLLRTARAHLGETGLLQKVFNSYSFANSLRHELDPFLEKIPEVSPLGYAVRFGDKEPLLWQPYFSRQVIRVLNSDEPAALRANGLEYVVVDRSALGTVHDPAIVLEPPSSRSSISSIGEWLAAFDAELVATGDVRVEPDAPPDKIYLVRLRN